MPRKKKLGELLGPPPRASINRPGAARSFQPITGGTPAPRDVRKSGGQGGYRQLAKRRPRKGY